MVSLLSSVEWYLSAPWYVHYLSSVVLYLSNFEYILMLVLPRVYSILITTYPNTYIVHLKHPILTVCNVLYPLGVDMCNRVL